ncbi:hypothetical protein F5Y18DRAFT_429802 [Xylariaceae sp. FL1019]|nr:hypothetical protein F5Y18DRAFT_429802 [Xylariaceae sp. FL1019]
MATLDSFPQFSRLPPELRLLIWEFACRSTPMRLAVRRQHDDRNRSRIGHAWSGSYHICIPSLRGYPYGTKHQRQRLAILAVNKESRSEALKHLHLIRLSGSNSTLRCGVLAIDWHNDLFHVTRPDSRNLCATIFLANRAKIKRMLIHVNEITTGTFGNMNTSGFLQHVIDKFPGLNFLGIIIEVENGKRPVRGTDWLDAKCTLTDSCFVPSTLDDRNYSSLDKKKVAEIRSVLQNLRPSVEVEAVLDMEHW